MNKYCRICIAEEGTIKIFYENTMGQPLHTRIMNCALVKVFLNDGLPDVICENCLNSLNIAHTFKLKCEESDNTLRKMLVHNNEETDSTLNLYGPKVGVENVLQNQVNVESTNNTDSSKYLLSGEPVNYENSCVESSDSLDSCVDKDGDKESGENTSPACIKDKVENKRKPRFKRTRKKSKIESNDGVGVEEKIYVCEVCSKSYSDRRQMRRHQITHRDKKRYCCHVCSKQFHFKGNLQVHERIHTGERPFLCNSCGKSFVQIAGLQRHLTIHNDDKPFICNICNKRFKLADTLAGHIRTHTLERPYKCDKCSKSFSHHSGLNKHLRVHTGEKNYQCSQCGKSFSRSDSLSEHLKIHTGERPYNCVTCDAAFSSKSTLRVHTRTHTSEKPYRCRYCNKSFTQSSVLGRHIRTHTGERPYKCTLCEQSFSLKVRLAEHVRSAHSAGSGSCDINSMTNNTTSVQQYYYNTNNTIPDQQFRLMDNQQQIVSDNSNNYPVAVLSHSNVSNFINIHNRGGHNVQINTNLHFTPAPSMNLQDEHLRYIDIMKNNHPYCHTQL